MVLERRADVFQLQAVHILHHSHAVRVAHADAGHVPILAFHGQDLVHQCILTHIHGGQVGGHGAVSAHLHLPQARALMGDGLQAAEGVDGQRLLRDAVGVEPLGHTANAVAAHLSLAAVGVEDAHHGIRPGGARCADADDAVCPDGKMPPGQLFRKGRDVLRHTGCAAVQIDVIVGAALHFGK